MTLRTALAAGLLLAAPLASAQKPAERSPYEVGQDAVEATRQAGPDLLVAPDGTPRALYHPDYAVRPASPEEMARQYLAENAALLRLDPTLDDLVLRASREGLAGTSVRFTQTVRGIPVYAPDIVVSIDRQHRVQFVLSTYHPDLTLPAARPAVTEAEARALVGEHLHAQAPFQFDETKLVVVPEEGGTARLAWNVRLVPTEPIGDWEALVDAHDGSLLRVADRAVTERGEDPPAIPSVAALAYPMPLGGVDGTGYVFHPDPLTRAGVTYGTPGYVDNNDADSPELTAARSFVRIRDLTFDGTNYKLDGPYAAIRDFEGPFDGLFEQTSSNYDYGRSAQAFEAVNTYFDIDRAMRFINERLHLDVLPFQYAGGVQFDPHGLSGVDNSHYIPSTGRLAYGEGCVDDAEDADVIVHELGHGLHDWVTHGGLSQVQGLSEGTGDYTASSYTRHFGILDTSDPSYYWVFKWDGHNPCWPGRVTNYQAHYPEGLTGVIHTDGQMWSSTLMAIWDDIGGNRTDAAVLEGLAMTNSGTNQPQAAQAVLQAGRNLGFPDAAVQAMYDRFSARGYPVTLPPAPAQALQAAAVAAEEPMELTAAYPNPFQNAASFTLSVAATQRVEVTLYDALGRRVQTLFSGTMNAGERRVLSIDAHALPNGLYVYRAVGEGLVASQTVMLAR